MEAVILAGGFGTRLHPLTETLPKALIPLMNKSLIDHVLDTLPSCIETVVLALGVGHEKVIEYVSKKRDREYIFSVEEEPLGTGGALKKCHDKITDTFLVLNADAICKVDFELLIEEHRKKQGMGTIVLFETKNPEQYGIVDMDTSCRINSFLEKPSRDVSPSRMANAGVYVFEKSVLDMIPQGHVSLEREIFPNILTNGLYGFFGDGIFIDAGDRASYLEAQHLLTNNRDRPLMLSEGTKCQGSLGDNVCLGSRVELAAGSFVANSALFDSVKVGQNSHIQGCIVGERSNIGEYVVLKNSIVGYGVVVEDETEIDRMAIGRNSRKEVST